VRFKLVWQLKLSKHLNPARRPGHAHAVLGQNTHEYGRFERQQLAARAFDPKARSHDPITAPERCAVPNQTGHAFCEGQGGDRAAGGGHVAKRMARLIQPEQ